MSRWSPKWQLLPETSRPSFPATESLPLLDADNRQPFRDERPSPAQSAAGANPNAPTLSPVLAFLCSRHSPCRQSLISPVGVNVSTPQSGRFSGDHKWPDLGDPQGRGKSVQISAHSTRASLWCVAVT